MNILVVRNSETAPEGAFGDWLRAQGHVLVVVAAEAVTPAQMQAAPLVLLLGSPRGAYQTEIPWVAAQRPMVAARLAARLPTIGICFGAQMMAAAAGGAVARHPEGRFFRGWLGIEETADPALAGPWPRWHGDVIIPPPEAEVLARDAGTVQAFALPNAIAVQFHPEATPALLRDWARLSPEGAVAPGTLDNSETLFAERASARARLFTALMERAGAA
ncbi:glutamine amidotransferase-related protein [Falsiroseomonas selenitidurans]|uniref:C26 family cysteine hydrolase domain-containing family n=1 Tax=Falsiroseomonas selenitidurans TaxID=2716335 RepID=A0ABX1E0T4_9PROT|nr:gamma-glutamyl-gamma-aminobutyrate hydrolase family protein [Falsiroseomonas selenitidurans]NKC30755.1 C26 family cysteine hydrolase domain-containing family [Falsiroseomonas selenitidurans]